MRILLLGSKEYPFHSGEGLEKKPSGGIEVHVEKLAKYLAKNKSDVFVITRRFPGQKRTEKNNNITVIRTPFVNNSILRTFSFNLFSFIRSLQMVKKQKIDVIHCHGQVAGMFGFLLSKYTRRPVFYTPHGVAEGWSKPIRYLLHLFDRIAIKGAKKVLFISPRAMDIIGKYAKNKILLTNAIDLDDYRETGTNDGPPRFLFAGRLVQEKGLKILLEAFKRLQKDVNEAELLIAGTGPYKSYVKNFITENPDLNIKFLGWRKDIPNLLKKSDAFVLPSEEKGQPIALLEAKASSKVVITSLPYIEDKKTGLWFRPKSVDGLYKKMLYLCENRIECQTIGSSARESIRNISWDKVVIDFIEQYKS